MGDLSTYKNDDIITINDYRGNPEKRALADFLMGTYGHDRNDVCEIRIGQRIGFELLNRKTWERKWVWHNRKGTTNA